MTGDIHELRSEIMRANAYTAPARIVSRYRAIRGLALAGEMPCDPTMQEMLEMVVAVDFATDQGDSLEDILSAIARR
jgi:hypothetical protein